MPFSQGCTKDQKVFVVVLLSAIVACAAIYSYRRVMFMRNSAAGQKAIAEERPWSSVFNWQGEDY